MRRIRLPDGIIDAALKSPNVRTLSVPVVVDWPELRLSEEQILANAAALAFGKPEPYPNPAMFTVEIQLR